MAKQSAPYTPATPAAAPGKSDAGQGGAQGSGTDTLEIKGTFDPNAARKALFARYGQISQANREIELEETPGARELQAGYEEGGTIEDESQPPEPIAEPPPPEAEPLQSAPPVVDSGTEQPELVQLTVFGQTVMKPKAEVDAAGGALAMQFKLAAEHRVAQAAELGRKAAEASRNVLDKDRILATKLQEVTRAPTPASTMQGSQPSSAPPASPNQAAAQDVLVDARKVVEGLWSGNPEVAEKAFSEVLANLNRGTAPQTLDPNKIAELVMAKVERDLAVKDEQAAKEQERLAVNDLMRSDRFKPIMETPEIKATTQLLFREALSDKRNQGRSKVEIANEVGSRVLSMIGKDVPNGDARQNDTSAAAQAAAVQSEINARTNFKRRLPVGSNASERSPAAVQAPTFPTRASDVVNMLRAARGQPPQ